MAAQNSMSYALSYANPRIWCNKPDIRSIPPLPGLNVLAGVEDGAGMVGPDSLGTGEGQKTIRLLVH
jgi:hypothetical protein